MRWVIYFLWIKWTNCWNFSDEMLYPIVIQFSRQESILELRFEMYINEALFHLKNTTEDSIK